MAGPIKYHPHRKRILFGTTVGLSAMALLRGQLAWFRERGWEVILVTTPDPDAKRAARREKISLMGVAMKRNISLLHDLKSAMEWLGLVRRVRPDVVNLGTPKASLLGSFAAWAHRVPRRIYTVRGLRLEGASGLLARLLWVMERATIKMATDVVVISPSLGKELVRRKLVAPDDVWLIGEGSSNGVDAAQIERQIAQVDKCSLRRGLGIAPGKFVAGYVGRVTPEKGVDTLVAALNHKKLSDNVELLIIGSIEDSDLGSKIEKSGHRIHVVPWTDDLWGYLPAMDLLCLPTLREGFGNVVIEAAAAGIPALTTRVTGAVDTLIHGTTGFHVDVGDVEAIVQRINLLANDRALLRRLGVNAKQRATEDFKPGDIWSGIEAIAEGRHGVTQLRRLDHYLEIRDSI